MREIELERADIHRDYGLADQYGRSLGGYVLVRVLQRIADDGQSCIHFTADAHNTRNGRRFGAGAPPRRFASPEARDRYVSEYFKRAEARMRQRFARIYA